MNKYRKIQNAIDSYLAQEKLSDEIADKINNANETFMGEYISSEKERAALESEFNSVEKGLSFALKTLANLVDECPIDLINRYTEDKAQALKPYI